MNILYVSSLCSDKKFKEIFHNSNIKPTQAAQKFHSLLSKGLMSVAENMYIMSRPPVNLSSNEKETINVNNKTNNSNVMYHYLSIVKNPILKHINLFINGFISSFKWNVQFRKQDRVVICDVLNLSVSVSAFLTSKLFCVKSVAIVTDIPNYMKNYTVGKKPPVQRFISNLYTGICNFFMYRYDSFIFLTEQMNELVNPSDKPYIVIEGMVDTNMENIPNSLEAKYDEKIVLYAGALHEKYGVKKLINAFMKLKNDNIKLWLYGSGEMENEIKNYEKIDHRIKYFGIVPNEVVVKQQLKATILVNPRPSSEEFTKYSFPSKNMEYMASGTPTLTTKLPGMPKEYYDYIYLIEDETVDGLILALKEILNKSKEELHAKGVKAKEFVLKRKNNLVQAEKIVDVLINGKEV
jgi:glycosyltransferase involved in cell wall biosynthesis